MCGISVVRGQAGAEADTDLRLCDGDTSEPPLSLLPPSALRSKAHRRSRGSGRGAVRRSQTLSKLSCRMLVGFGASETGVRQVFCLASERAGHVRTSRAESRSAGQPHDQAHELVEGKRGGEGQSI